MFVSSPLSWKIYEAQGSAANCETGTGPWYKEYPGSKAIGPEGLVEKRKKQHNEDVPFAVEYSAKTKETTTVDADFDSNFDVEYVDGHANKVSGWLVTDVSLI